MDTPLVSVIIPTLNEAADIAGCIRAIGAQDHPICSIEVLLVDGDSDDGTIEEANAPLPTSASGTSVSSQTPAAARPAP